MYRTLLLPLVLCAAFSGYAQSGPVITKPTWKVGEKRQVDITDAMRMTMDSVQYDITTQGSYTLTVLSAQKDGYVIAVRTDATDVMETEGKLKAFLTGEAPDPLKQFLQKYSATLYKPLEGLESRFKITPEGVVSGQVDPVGTVEALRPALAKVVEKMRDAVAEFRGQEPGPLPKARVDYLSDSLYAELVRSQVHELHRFMRIYGTTFPLTGSQRKQVNDMDVRSPLRYEYLTVPAMVEGGLDVVDPKKMTCRTITTYNSDALFAAMTKDKWTTDVKPENLQLSDESVTQFNRATSWPTASTSELEFRCGGIRIHITSKANYEELR